MIEVRVVLRFERAKLIELPRAAKFTPDRAGPIVLSALDSKECHSFTPYDIEQRNSLVTPLTKKLLQFVLLLALVVGALWIITILAPR